MKSEKKKKYSEEKGLCDDDFKTLELKLRPLEKEDYHKNYLDLLCQLTIVGDITEKEFNDRFDLMKMQDACKIVVIEDTRKRQIVAAASLILEPKFVHNCGMVGHIEDVVVSQNYRGQQLGKTVVKCLQNIARENGCYKVILDCKEENVGFYQKLGMVRKELQLACYFDQEEYSQHNDNNNDTATEVIGDKRTPSTS